MRRIIVVAAAVLGIALLTNPSFARSEPKKAGKFKSTLVTAYNECTDDGVDDDIGDPNDTTTSSLPLPACHPAVPSDDTCSMGADASGQMAAKVDASGDIAFKLKLKDVQGCNGQTLVAVVSVRVTTDGCTSGDLAGCTVKDLNDFPISNAPPAGASCVIADGKCQMASTVNAEVGAGTIEAGNLAAFELKGCGLKRVAGPGSPGKVASCGLLIR